MATTWIPLTRFDKAEWLLANGDIITEPNLEQTTTGLKVRVTGTKASFYSKDLETLLANAAQQVAKDRSTHVVCGMTNLDEAFRSHAPRNPPTFFTGASHREDTKLWWKFTHPKMAYSVYVIANLTRYGENYTLKSSVLAPVSLHNRYGMDYTAKVRSYDTWADLMYAEQQTNKIGYDTNLPSWTDSSEPLTFGQERSFIGKLAAYKALLKMVQYMENLDFLSWPEVHTLGQGVLGYMELEQEQTNLPSDFRADLQDHLDNSPDAARLKELYEEMIVVLKRIGLVVHPDSEGFLKAVEARLPLRVPLGQPTDVGNSRDYTHTLALDIPSGTFVVECGASHVDMNEVAAEWEQAKTIAALTGEEDALLAYARRYAEKNSSGKTKRIMKERGLNVPN